MTDDLLDPLRHNTWATKNLIAFCRNLSSEQLAATAEGTYGPILPTLQHVVGAESRYSSRLAGREPTWAAPPEETDDLGELARMVEEMGGFWEELAGSDFDPDRSITWVSRDSGAGNEARAGILVAQTLNHGNEHRAQIYTILTTIDLEPPDLDAWSYAIETGRYRETSPGSAIG
jgi:uncharacterized damage-inducible protein DinB